MGQDEEDSAFRPLVDQKSAGAIPESFVTVPFPGLQDALERSNLGTGSPAGQEALGLEEAV